MMMMMMTVVVTAAVIVVTFMQGIYNYVAKTNHVSRVYSVAAIL
jgi:hypothetical protein